MGWNRKGREVKALFLFSKILPSSRLRMLDCFEAYRAAGIDCTVRMIPSDPVGRLRALYEASRHDVVVLQKKTSLHRIELALLTRFNPRIVFDFDDAVMFHELEHRRPFTGKPFVKFVRTINHCAAVVAGNRFLASFAEPNCSTVHVLPTPIDLDRYRLKDYGRSADTVTIGWIGVAGNLYYLQDLASVFQRLAKDYPAVRLKVVSNRSIEIPGVPIQFEPWSLNGEVPALQSFDIGIMPLRDTIWARGKCGFKILQYMGTAVPAVASPVGINSEFIQHGVTGFLTTDEGEWERALRQLIEQPAMRREMGLKGRRVVEERYSKAHFASRYVEILREVVGGSHESRARAGAS